MLRRSISLTLGLLLGVLLCTPLAARAQARAYRGPHPVDLDGHWHNEDGVHVHDTLAVGLEPFADVDGVLFFLADPAAYGWTGAVWSYRGAHPLPGGVPGYCGIRGDHSHGFAPEGTYRRAADGTHIYSGAMRGGLRLVTPGRTAPRHPIVTATGAPPGVSTNPGLAPFWYDGCMHRLVMAADGSFHRVSMGGCTPRRRFSSGSVRVRPTARPLTDLRPRDFSYTQPRAAPVAPTARPRARSQR